MTSISQSAPPASPTTNDNTSTMVPSANIPTPQQSRSSTTLLRKWFTRSSPTPSPPAPADLPPRVPLPETSSARLVASSSSTTSRDEKSSLQDEAHEKTVLYLAYGSNLAASTFLVSRGIKPLSSTNVLVPSLRLTFDLPGIPYKEPCFANTARRDPKNPVDDDPAWKHGLVGVVYEVTATDYAHIIATEGGGGGYTDVEVECWKLKKQIPDTSEDTGTNTSSTTEVDSDLPLDPSLPPFKAHTLLAPPGTNRHIPSRLPAQPSPRYLSLLTVGAAEHSLPEIYQTYLNSLPTYHITTFRQTIGRAIIVTLFYPALLALFALGKVVADKRGRYPGWLLVLQARLFRAVWVVYKVVRVGCGDGERTEGSAVVEALDSGKGVERHEDVGVEGVKKMTRRGSIFSEGEMTDEEKALLRDEETVEVS